MDSSDTLRKPIQALEPDARTKYLVRLDSENHVPRPITLADQHNAISLFSLNPTVPDEIVIHFETAKNLYLYAWFVFRFYPVAEQQAFASLEFALREKLMDFVIAFSAKHPKSGGPGLSRLLSHAKSIGLIQNEALAGRKEWALSAAKTRYSMQKFNEMIAAGLEEMEFDDSQLTPTEVDLKHDWLGDFIKAIPKIRNDYAHGSSTLHHSVLHTFDLVSQLINQLYSATAVRSTTECPSSLDL